MIDVNIKYRDAGMPPLRMDAKGDWVDVRVSTVEIDGQPCPWRPGTGLSAGVDVVTYDEFQHVLIRLGFAMHFPAAYEAHVLPRSSLFRKTGLVLTNGMGLIDHTYCGDGDEWLFPCLAMRPGLICRHQRVGQFRLMPRMLPVRFREVESLGNADRGGYGSTDKRPGLQLAEEMDEAWGWAADLKQLRDSKECGSGMKVKIARPRARFE
jgi:dUTP pyrophosphatase